MGATDSKQVDSETCRIIVEDVTSSTTSQEVTLPEVFSPVDEERRRSSASSETTVCATGSRRGSTLSIDTRRSSGGGVTEFWVPDSVIQRTRSRSLVPPDQISPDDSDSELRGARSVNTLTSSLSDQSQLSPDHVTTRPRRASMYDALDFTKIDASLYQRPPLSSKHKTTAICGGSQVLEENLGSMQFSLEYDMDTSILALELMQANDLSPVGRETSPSPYVIVRLLPDMSNYLQTRVHRQTRSPFLDERFIFDVGWSQLASRTVQMKIYHENGDASRRDDCIGLITVPLDQLDLTTKCLLCKGISPDDKQTNDVGDVLFSLSYLPSAERLTLVVVEVRNLRSSSLTDVTNSPTTTQSPSSVYVKASLFVSGKKLKKKKTTTSSMRPTTMNAVWNEALVFTSLSRQQLQTCTRLELVLHQGHHGDAVGKVTVGCDKDIGEEEIRHWTDMLSGRPAVAKWHQLNPLTVTASSSCSQITETNMK